MKSKSELKALLHQRVQMLLKGGSQQSCQIHKVMFRMR